MLGDQGCVLLLEDHKIKHLEISFPKLVNFTCLLSSIFQGELAVNAERSRGPLILSIYI